MDDSSSSSATVIQILKTNIGLSIIELESRIRGVFARNNIHATLQKENILLTGQQHVIRRLFIQTSIASDYSNVGWVLNEDLDSCMICSQEFNVFRTKQHCYSCGNLVCSVCSCEDGIIYELEDMGPLRVCFQCFWGQEPVYTRYTRIEDSMLEDATRRWSAGNTSPVQVSSAPIVSSSKVSDSYLQNSISDDEDEEFHPAVSRNSKMIVRKSTDAPVTHRPMFSGTINNADSENDPDILPKSTIPFQKRESGGNTTTLVELFPFRDESAPHVETDHSDNDSEPSEPIPLVASSPSNSWNAMTIFSTLLGSNQEQPSEKTSPPPKTEAQSRDEMPTKSSLTTDSQEHSSLSPSSSQSDVPISVAVVSNPSSAPLPQRSPPPDKEITIPTKQSTPPSESQGNLNEIPSNQSTHRSEQQGNVSEILKETERTSTKSKNEDFSGAASRSSSSDQPTLSTTRIPSFEAQRTNSSDQTTSRQLSSSNVSAPTLRTLPPITPTPFTVLKTKRLTNNCKVFINVLTIPEAYFDSIPHLIIHSLHHTEDKGGESCDVFDICCSDSIISLNDNQEIIDRCISIIQKINLDYRESLDCDYKTPKIKNNYKGNEIKPFYSEKQVTLAEIQKDSKLFYIFNELSSHENIKEEEVQTMTTSIPPSSPTVPVMSIPPPAIMKGWMKKEGHQFKTIKRRYFVLQEGELKYYEKPLGSPPYGEKLKGTFPLKDGSVQFGTGDGKPLGKGSNQRLYIQALV